MNTVKIHQLNSLSPTQFHRLRDAQMEAAHVWNCCMELHQSARLHHEKWPGRNELQKATKRRFQLHSQSVQMVVHAFLANIDTTRQLRQTHPQMRMRYPYKEKRFYPVHWPAQAVSRENGRVVLPMGRGRPSLTKAHRLTCRASLAPNEEQVASVLPVGISISRERGNGPAKHVVSEAIETSWGPSICIRSPLANR